MRKSFLLRCLALCMILCTALGCFAIVGTGAENQPAADLDNDPGSLTYTVSEDGSTVTITDELPADAALVARLLPKETPTPDCYEIASD